MKNLDEMVGEKLAKIYRFILLVTPVALVLIFAVAFFFFH